jgi:membrane protein implicated in regulation of membrane protease activity
MRGSFPDRSHNTLSRMGVVPHWFGTARRWAGSLLGGGIVCRAWLVLAVVLLAMLQRPGVAAASGGSGSQNTPLDVVILVDESGSESHTDVQHEQEAAATIAQTPLNPRSRVTVIGFGGADGDAPNQDPTTVVCQPTITSGSTNLEYLARCVRKLHRRTPAEGDNTDYAAALGQAMSVLSQGTASGAQPPTGAVKAILMMTDGGLDVFGDPQYPQPNWQPAAHHAVNVQLAAARVAGAEVWPLGFGNISPANAHYLRYLASHGGQHTCDSRRVSKPRATVAQNSARALSALFSLYAAASCSGISRAGPEVVPDGQSRVLSVNIPPIASSGAISVNKVNPALRVDYLTPNGTEVTGGRLGGSTFVRSGQDTSVEVLHITNPQPGTWQVRVTAPHGEGGQLVSVTAFWQGAVRVSLTASPATARPGQRIGVVLSVLGANGPITDPVLLSGMHVGVTASGDGLSSPAMVPVRPATGNSAGLTAGDFTGSFKAPSTTGPLSFLGTAVGYGLYATQVPTQVNVSNATAFLQATVQFSAPDTVQSGQEIPGEVLFDNKTGQSQRVRLTLTALPALATITESAGDVTVPSGTSITHFAIELSPRTPVGAASLVIRVVDAGHPAISYGDQQLLVNVVHPPGVLGKHKWQIAGLAALVLLVMLALLLRRLERRRQIDVRDLSVSLSRDGTLLGHELKAPGKESDSFRFMIRDEDGTDPRLDYPQRGDRPYLARRVTHGRIRVRASDRVKVVAPDGGKYNIAVGSVGEPLPNGIYLSFQDRRHRPRPPTSRPRGERRPPEPSVAPPTYNYNLFD